MTDRIHLFDTTLRDGQQTQGVQFSAAEKREIATLLDTLGIDHIEGGWPGANPTDSEFFDAPSKTRATLVAFGMTKRTGRSAANDDTLAAVLNAGTPSVCLVGKTHVKHVAQALGITNEENLDNIRESIAHLVAQGREAIFDAEHFFDGHALDPAYARACVETALEAGARWVALCDTNGGTMPAQIGEVVGDLIAKGIPGDRLGIHTHDDTGQAVAGSLAAIDAGARQVQGTLNGLGERCGNANLTTLIPTLLLKEPYRSQYVTGVPSHALPELLRISRRLDDILNRVPRRESPYVGASAFAHKAGLHASAVAKDPALYEHVSPSAVGNARIVPMSNQAGLSNLRERLAAAGLSGSDAQLQRILSEVKSREDRGYTYDGAQASFELLARKMLGKLPDFFEVKRYRVTVERRKNRRDEMISLSEAVVVVKVDGEKRMSVSDSMESGADAGPVNALSKALSKDLGRFQQQISDMQLKDFRVRIMQGGTEAVTRVIIDHEDASGRRWSTVGVSANIVDASFEALLDAIRWKLCAEGGAR
ncbi:citramalate synthase [Jannaschia aquimarina]|uniref:Citramalate synthase n=1 Tax=Jannaschia aquimarina TaxID=935700 RepID=A0A0D1EE66_9RHOB|nr:citramalate synthase [Jannaschia aquimarina]KIT15201.1 2-isopropylmalate synthase [Jannaschia aquimarina]SNT32992.1 2-isopropylmalate synthase [Jannaschia aquimarina]